MAGGDLGIAPHWFAIGQGVRHQSLLSAFIRGKFRAGVVVGLTWRKRIWFAEKQIAALKGDYIEKPSVGIVRRRKPIGGPVDAGADKSALRRWHSAGKYGSAGCVHTCGPVELLHKWRCCEKFAGDTIENVEKSVAVGLHQKVSGFAALFDIDEHWGFVGVKVIQVVRRELEIPLQLSCVRIQGQEASCIKVVAGAGISHKIGSGITGGPVNGVELGIVGTGHPGGSPAMQVRIAGPTGGAKFSRPRNGPETPLQGSSQGVEGR